MVEEWEKTYIGNSFDFKNGLNKAKEFFGKGTPIINYTDVYKKRGLYKSDIKGKVTLSLDEIRRFKVEKNDVFFTRTSETPEEVGFASVLLEEIENCVFSGFVLRAHPKNERFFPPYCKYCFMTPDVREAITKSCTYTTRALTNGRQLSAIEILLPSYAEQQRIAEALTDIDELIVSLEKLIAKKKAIKQGAMQELLTGKRRLPGFKGEWHNQIMKNYVDFLVGFPFSSEFFNDNSLGLRLIRNRDLKYDDQIVYSTEATDDSFIVENGDVLVGMDGDFLPCIWNKGKAMLNQRVGKLLFRESLIGRFAYYAFQKPLMELQDGTGATTVKHLSHGDIKRLKVFMPPSKEEQKAVSSILADLDEEIHRYEERIAKARQIKKGMMQQLLTGNIRLV